MPQLPVPPLTQSLDRYLQQVQVLQTAIEHEATRAAAVAFGREEGPGLQHRLESLADEARGRGETWLTRMWLDTYLHTRGPLQLTSSVALQISWPSGLFGVDRAADFAHRITAVHAQYMRGELDPSINARGQELTAAQWRFLSGGIRTPGEHRDEFEDGSNDPHNRSIIVLHRGHGYLVQATNARGYPVPPESLKNAFDQILAEEREEPGTFADLGPLGSPDAAAVVAGRLADDADRVTYGHLRDALFVLDLTASAKDDLRHLRALAFEADGVVAHKTTTYRLDVDGDFVGVNLEHSITDGATLADLIARAKAVDPASTAGPNIVPVPLRWRIPGAPDPQEFSHRAEGVAVVRIDTPAVEVDGVRLSHDAAMQWVLLYAQLRTWARVRSTYEAVDMREYTAGRTDSFRPHTPAAVDFVSSLIGGSATWEQFQGAARAHSEQIKGAKTGQGFERHLFALHTLARSQGEAPELFRDPGFGRFNENFLSTTSLGIPDHVTRLAFAPTAPGGIGVNYTRTSQGYEFCLSYDATTSPDAGTFGQFLPHGVDALRSFLLEQVP